jgi:hypothetical protein
MHARDRKAEMELCFVVRLRLFVRFPHFKNDAVFGNRVIDNAHRSAFVATPSWTRRRFRIVT